MKTHILRIWLYAVLCISFWTCKSSNSPTPLEQLPPATQTGANTFGCLIDGQAWIPNGTSGFIPSPAINGGYLGQSTFTPPDPQGRDKYNIQFRTYKKDGLSMQIYVEKVEKTGRYELNFDTETSPNLVYPKSYGYYSIRNATPATSSSYVTTSQVIGYVNFTVADTVMGKLAGTFEFDAIDKNSGKIIKITNGRFDIDPATLNK
jgi:hypothetical protein